MQLFLEPTSKAISQVSTTGVESKSEDRELESHHESYSRRPVGVASGHEADPDDPKVGKRWHGDGESNDDGTSALREERKKKDEKSGMIAKKSFSDACDMLKSITAEVEDDIRKSMPNDAEIEFLTQVMGHDRGEVIKGLHWIAGTDRDLFNTWMCDRMCKSLDALIRSVP